MLGLTLSAVAAVSLGGAWGLHVAGATDEQPVTANLSGLAFLHVPKTGTAFINSLLTIGCPGITEEEHNDLKVTGPNQIRDWMANLSSKCQDGFNFCNGNFASHIPIVEGNMKANACNNYVTHKGEFFGMFRVPEQRVISAYHNGKHSYYGKHANHSLNTEADRNISLEYFARGSRGCAVKMMAGNWMIPKLHLVAACAWTNEINYLPSKEMVQLAVRRLREGFRFVGLVEEWDLSVCLLHAMFGGECHVREFQAERSSKPAAMRQLRKAWDTAPLHGVRDEYDAELYRHARGIFWANVKKYNVDAASCKRICPNFPERGPNGSTVLLKVSPDVVDEDFDTIDVI